MAKELKKEEEKIEEAQDSEEQYIPDEEDKKILSRVYTRFSDMKNSDARVEYEKNIDEADKDYNGWMEEKDEDDYRSNINKPIGFSLIETMVQETIERKPRPKVAQRSSTDAGATMMTNDVMGFSFDVGEFDYQHFLAKKESYKRGTGFLFEYYRYDTRVVEEMDLKKGDNGAIEEIYKKKEKIDYDDLYSEYIPGEWLYFDPSAHHISKCKDAIRREVINIDEFYRIYENKRGFKDVSKVRGGGNNSWPTYYTPPEGMEKDTIEVLHYYNRAIDRYDVVASGIVIRRGPSPFPHKEIPFIPLYCYKDPGKFYGIGVPHIIRALVEERNTIANLRTEATKMGLAKMYFYDDMVEIDDIDLMPRPHGGIPINTNGRPINQVIQWVDYDNIPRSSYQEEEILIEDIRRTTGIDDRIQGMNVGGTATEAAILKDATMKRINGQNVMNEMDGLVRLGKLRLENIKFFYSIPKFKQILGEDDSYSVKEEYRNITVKDKEYKLNSKGELVIEESEGTYGFKLDKTMMKFLDNDYDITVLADSQYVISKPLYQTKITEMIDRLTANPILMNEINPRKLAKRYLQINDEDPRDWLSEKLDREDAEFLAQQENEVMFAGYPIPPTKGATQEHTDVHLFFAEGEMFNSADPVIQAIVENHIKGEAMAMGALMPEGEGAPNAASQLPDPNINPIDINPNSPMQNQE